MPPRPIRPSRDDASHPHVYLMRGLLNIFSLGMDQLAAQIARNGIDASVYNHSVEETVVGTIVQKTALAITALTFWSAIRSAPTRSW